MIEDDELPTLVENVALDDDFSEDETTIVTPISQHDGPKLIPDNNGGYYCSFCKEKSNTPHNWERCAKQLHKKNKELWKLYTQLS